MKKWMILAMLSAFVVSLAGCNTVRGVGEDVEDLGEGIQDTTD